MKKYLVFIVFFTTLTCCAQVRNFSVYLGASLPIIPSVDQRVNTEPIPIATGSGYSSFYTISGVGLKESFSHKQAFSARGQFDYPLSNQFYITSGLSFNYVQFHRHTTITSVPAGIESSINFPTAVIVGQPLGTIFGSSGRDGNGNIIVDSKEVLSPSKNVGKTRVLFLQVPVLIGRSILRNKLQLRTGPVFSYLFSSSEVKQDGVLSGMYEYTDRSGSGFNQFQAGISLQTTFMLGRVIGIDVGAQFFFTSIYADAQAAKAKYNFLSLGVSYTFRKV